MIQARIFVSGFVQGVGYRAFVIYHARAMEIVGWTRNLSDGRVEILAQAEKTVLDKFIEKLRAGSMVSEVKSIVVDFEQIEDRFESFDKMPTK